MIKPLKIAIYSGQIPSTTFIERLIKGFSTREEKVLLFGIKRKSIKYSQSILVVGYKNDRFSKALHFLKYSLLLLLFNSKEKGVLDNILKLQNRNTWNDKLKSYPVLYYKPDVFHIQWAKGLKDWMWVQEFGMKLVLSLRGAHINYSPITEPELGAMYRNNFPKVNGFHAVSHAIALEASKYGVNLGRIRVVKSGLNLKENPFDLKSKVPTSKLQIISVGRNHWIKNYSLALDAMSVLKKKDIAFHYSIVGVDTEESLLFQREQLQLQENVSFIKALSFEEAQMAIKNADILLLPSLEEGIANVVIEAMMLGTLVVSTDCGGMAELVKPLHTGYLVPIRDVEAMASAIEAVTTLSLEAYQAMLLEARAFVEQEHTEEQMVNRMQDLYESLF